MTAKPFGTPSRATHFKTIFTFNDDDVQYQIQHMLSTDEHRIIAYYGNQECHEECYQSIYYPSLHDELNETNTNVDKIMFFLNHRFDIDYEIAVYVAEE